MMAYRILNVEVMLDSGTETALVKVNDTRVVFVYPPTSDAAIDAIYEQLNDNEHLPNMKEISVFDIAGESGVNFIPINDYD
jgi:hypothetical protein